MPTLRIISATLFISLTIFFEVNVALAQQSSIIIDQLNPSPSPQPSGSAMPIASPPTNIQTPLPSANPTPASSLNPFAPTPTPTTQKSFTPKDTPIALCSPGSLIINYAFLDFSKADQERLKAAYDKGDLATIANFQNQIAASNPEKFALIYPNPRLLLSEHQPAPLGNGQLLMRIIDLVAKDVWEVKVNWEPGAKNLSLDDFKKQIGLEGLDSSNIAPYFYYVLAKILDHSEMEYLKVNTVKGEIIKVSQTIARLLNEHNLPNMPFLLVNQQQLFIQESLGVFDNYPQAPTWRDGLRTLGCNPENPKFSISASPIINLYGHNIEAVNLKFKNPNLLTYAEQRYSFNDGFRLSKSNSLYYEFNKEEFITNLSSNNLSLTAYYSVVIAKDNLKKYLYQILLPKLALTENELNQFIQKDINPQLNNLNSTSTSASNYQITLFSTSSLNNLLPIQISPTPDTLIRNLILISPTNNPITDNPKQLDLPLINKTRIGDIVVVENGFILINDQ